jgi:hypothetical protein
MSSLVSISQSGYLYAVQNAAYYLVGCEVVCLGLVAKANAVTEHIVCNGAHILGDYIAAALYKGIGACCKCKVD